MTLAAMYTEHRRRFIFKLYPFTKNYDVAEDLLQEAIIKAFVKYDQYDPQKGAMKGWFTKILFSCLWDYLREQRKPPQILDIDSATEADLSSYTEDKELVTLLEEISNPLHKKMLYAKLVFGYSYGETAEMLNTTKTSVRKTVQRFRKEVDV